MAFFLSTAALLFASSVVASTLNPFEVTPKLKEYAQRASVAVHSQNPEYFPIIQTDDADREAIYQYLRGEAGRPMDIYILILLDYSRLRLLRNEIYARNGRKFASFDLNTYFQHSSWYNLAEVDSDASLSAVEQENISLITRIEYVHFHRHEQSGTILKFSDEDGGTMRVPEVTGLVSVNYDGCCGSSWGSTAIKDRTGKLRFSSSFGYDGGSGTMSYVIPQWGNNLVAWISGEVEEEPKTHDRIVVLSGSGDPLVDMQLPSGRLPAIGYGGRLKQVVLLSPDVMYVNTSDNDKDEQHLLFLKRSISFKPQIGRLYQWRERELAVDDVESRCEQERPTPAITPISNPAVLWDRRVESALYPVITRKNILFFVPEKESTNAKGEERQRILALARESGKERWALEVNGRVDAAVVKRDHVAMAISFRRGNDVTRKLRLVNGETGKVEWEVIDDLRQEALLFTEDTLVEASAGEIDIFDLASGKRLKRIDLNNNEKAKQITFYSKTWKSYSGKLYYYNIVGDTFSAAAALPSGEILWAHSRKITPFGDPFANRDRIEFVGCKLFVIDVNSVIQIDLATGISKIIKRKPESEIIDYQAFLLLPLKKSYSWQASNLRYRLQKLPEGKLNCMPTILDNDMIYIEDRWPFKTIRLQRVCPEKTLVNNEPQFMERWGFSPWDQKTDGIPLILHVDHNYLFVTTGERYWAIGEEALADFTRRALKATW